MQCRRRSFTKHYAIVDRETSQFPEPMVGGDSRYRCCRGSRSQQRTSDEVHSPQSEVADWPHSEVFLASDAEGTFPCANGCTYFWQIQRPRRVSFQIFFELSDNHVVAT